MGLNFTWDGTSVLTKGFTTHYADRELPEEDRGIIETQRDGGIEVSKRYPPRIIPVEGRLEGSSYANLKGTIVPAFYSFLQTDSDVQLIFSDETDRYFNAQFKKMRTVKSESIFRILEIDFICADPFSYNTTADTDTQTGVVANDTTFTVTNSGHYYAFPTITITFNQAQTHIYLQNNTITDNRFDISKTFAEDDELEINCKDRTVKLNGTSSPAGIGDGGESLAEFILLAVGANQLQIGTDDADIDVDCDTSFEKVYLS